MAAHTNSEQRVVVDDNVREMEDRSPCNHRTQSAFGSGSGSARRIPPYRILLLAVGVVAAAPSSGRSDGRYDLILGCPKKTQRGHHVSLGTTPQRIKASRL